MAERELVMTGIGGQGVQLATQVLALAAVAEGRQVLLFGQYGGMMRGGNTDTSLVIADGPIEAPPILGDSWSVIILHDAYADAALAKVRADSLVLLNSTIVGELAIPETAHVVRLPVTDVAVDVGNIMTASLVMLGAYARLTGIVAAESLTSAMAEALPPYRLQHVPLNQRALAAGADLVTLAHPAWAVAA